jgi:hypothetical protein
VYVQVWIIGAAQTPRTLPWGRPADAPRSLSDVLPLAERHGVTYPEEVKLVLQPNLPPNVYAAYRLPGEVLAHEVWSWRRFLNRFDEIVIRIKPDVLANDEAIVAVMAHEAFELNRLCELLDGSQLRAEEVGKLINPGIDGNLHCQAWDDADARIVAWRAR